MISIIGAGPAGNYLAYILAKAGKKVEVFEEHEKIGLPVQCTGIVSNTFKDIIQPRGDFVINTVSMSRIISPAGRSLALRMKPNYILDRTRFDTYLADKARSAGAKYQLDMKFTGYSGDQGRYVLTFKTKGKEVEKYSDIIVGADGPGSSVANAASLNKGQKYMIGHQARIRYSNENIVEFYPHIGCFAWVVPEDAKAARIGVASYNSTAKLFKEFAKLKKIKKKDIIGFQAGPIPIYSPDSIVQKDRIYLLGDAAGQVKATSGGGIVQGLIAAECLAKAIIEGKDYRRILKKRLEKELKLHLFERKLMDKFSKDDWNQLINILDNKRSRKIFSSTERDNLIGLTMRLGLANPRLSVLGTRILLRLIR